MVCGGSIADGYQEEDPQRAFHSPNRVGGNGLIAYQYVTFKGGGDAVLAEQRADQLEFLKAV
jgi:hypothetical protein